MSADNWAVCPRCKIRTDKLNQARINRPGEIYGKVAADVYAKAVEEAKHLIEAPTTLREDYELGVNPDGSFYVSYGCSCRECNFKHEFKHEQKLKP